MASIVAAFFAVSASATPQSAPHTLHHQNPLLTPHAVQVALREGAVDIGRVGFDAVSGFGRLDAVALSLPEPGATAQLIAGVAGLLAISGWRVRSRRAFARLPW